MYTFLLILLVLDAILMGVVVLLQAGQGGGLASLGGGTTDMVVGGRQAVTILTTATWWTGGNFLFLSLLLSVIHANRSAGTTDVQRRLRETQQQAPTETGPSPLDQNTTPPPENQPQQPATPAPNQ